MLTDVSEELTASITLITVAIRSSEMLLIPTRRHGVTSQKTAIFILISVRTSNIN
jgi:hypothetical protein